MKRAVWGMVLLLLSQASVSTAAIRISAELSSSAIPLHGYLTNTITIAITPDASGSFLTNATVSYQSADPVHKGLTTLNCRYTEQLFYKQKRVLRERRIFLTYAFSPKYAGSVVLKPRNIHLVYNGVTNTVMTPVQTVAVTDSSGSALLLVFIVLVVFFAFVVWGFRRYRRLDPEEMGEEKIGDEDKNSTTVSPADKATGILGGGDV